jgi:hypothetical protein
MSSRFAFASCLCLCAVSLAAPDAKDDCTLAVERLAAAPSYSWKLTTEQPNGNAAAAWTSRVEYQEGVVEKNGFTRITIALGNNTVEAITRAGKVVVKQDAAWKTIDELSAEDGAQPGFGRLVAMIVQSVKLPGNRVAEYAAHVTQVKKDGDALTAEITGPYAASFLPRPGRPRGGTTTTAPTEPPDAKLSLKMWLKDGVLIKYETHVTGTVTLASGNRRYDRTTTVEISDVGSARVSVPDEARKKLE